MVPQLILEVPTKMVKATYLANFVEFAKIMHRLVPYSNLVSDVDWVVLPHYLDWFERIADQHLEFEAC